MSPGNFFYLMSSVWVVFRISYSLDDNIYPSIMGMTCFNTLSWQWFHDNCFMTIGGTYFNDNGFKVSRSLFCIFAFQLQKCSVISVGLMTKTRAHYILIQHVYVVYQKKSFFCVVNVWLSSNSQVTRENAVLGNVRRDWDKTSFNLYLTPRNQDLSFDHFCT